MTITIEGPLNAGPRHGRENTNDYVVVLNIDAGRFQHPFEVRLQCGSGPEGATTSERVIQGLKTGQMARATGGRLEFVTDHGFARFALRECVSVTVGDRVLL